MSRGRLSSYTPDLADRVCSRLAMGKALDPYAEMPARRQPGAVLGWATTPRGKPIAKAYGECPRLRSLRAKTWGGSFWQRLLHPGHRRQLLMPTSMAPGHPNSTRIPCNLSIGPISRLDAKLKSQADPHC